MNNKNSCTGGASVYTNRFEDSQAVYLTKDNFLVSADGTGDDSDAIQLAIYKAQEKSRYGIVLIPEGCYRISKTIYLGKGMRLIGYGKNRPLIVLGKNSPGYQTADPNDKGQANYMFWFTDRAPLPGEPIKDAGAGTFYSAISNINLKIEDGNPIAVALRTHFAQHSFISHVDIDIGKGKSGIYDVGNEIEDVRFFGGEYGIYTTKPSPGWQFMMVDTYFEGQSKAAIKTRQAGLTIVRMSVKNVPSVVETDPGFYEKLYMKDCRFENIDSAAVVISKESNPVNQINLRNIDCSGVRVLAGFRESGRIVEGAGDIYNVETFTHGCVIDKSGSGEEIRTIVKMEPLKYLPAPVESDIPKYPSMDTWVNLKSLGATGDGSTDDTRIIKDAVQRYRVIYMPQGKYRVTDTITLKPDTVLVGLNPIATQLVIEDNTEAFGGLGPPKPLLETTKGGNNIVSGIGLDVGGRNPRAVGCKWMSGSFSYMNDVKFVGGHGIMNADGSNVTYYDPSHSCDVNLDRKWDSQYWSLWITDGGGGVFKDIWTASSYAAAGMYISDTSTHGRIYAMSVEHHVRNEVVLKNISNWEFLALQLEEERAEGWNCQPLELENCSSLVFANLYLFKVIWHVNPYPYAIKTWNCNNIDFLNVHNYSQIKYTFDNTLFDVNSDTGIRPWEIASFSLSSKALLKPEATAPAAAVRKLAGGFEYIDAACADSRGNIYFCDSRWRRIYKWSAENGLLEHVADAPFKPLSMGFDKDNNLLVVVEYLPSKGATINGKPEVYTKPEDSYGTSYGYWYNIGSTVKVYTINPDKPEASMKVLEAVSKQSVDKVHKALHPANRWRDSSDYLKVAVNRADNCYVAPDGISIIPVCYDLMRANALLEAYPGVPFYAVDEYDKRTFVFDVNKEGYLCNPVIFAERGECNTAVDKQGNVYIPDGQIYVYDPHGELKARIDVPERPSCVVFGGESGDDLYITARTSLYKVNIREFNGINK